GILGKADSSEKISLYSNESTYPPISLNGSWRYYVLNDNLPTGRGYQASFQPFGDLDMKFNLPGAITHYRRELNLGDAVASCQFTVNGVQYKREYIASHPAKAILINLTATKPGQISFTAALSSAHKS